MPILLFSLMVVTAQEIATEEDIKNAGITPDSFLYRFDLAFERVTEQFSERAKLKHAQERMSEVKVMLQENKPEMAEKSRQSFNKLRLRIRNQTQINEHTNLMDNLGQKISTIASNGQLNETQKQEIKELINQHQERIREEVEEIKNWRLRREIIKTNNQGEE